MKARITKTKQKLFSNVLSRPRTDPAFSKPEMQTYAALSSPFIQNMQRKLQRKIKCLKFRKYHDVKA